MAALTSDQIELLHRARDDLAPWGGEVRLNRMQAELELLVALGLIEMDGEYTYRLTALGATCLERLSGPDPTA